MASCSVKLQPTVNSVECVPQQQQENYSSASKIKKLLSRQEIIALLNTLNQFAKSIEFVANIHLNSKEADKLEQERKLVEKMKEQVSEPEKSVIVAEEQETSEAVVIPAETEVMLPSVEEDTTASGNEDEADGTTEDSPVSRRNDHSPGYRRFLFSVFIAFAMGGMGLMLYASFPAFAKRNDPSEG